MLMAADGKKILTISDEAYITATVYMLYKKPLNLLYAVIWPNLSGSLITLQAL